MDNLETRRSGSFGRASSSHSSFRRLSSSLSFGLPHNVDDEVESETVSESGDIGDRALRSNRYSESGRLRLSFESVRDTGAVVPVQNDSPLQPSGGNPLSTDAIIQLPDDKKEDGEEVSWLLDYTVCLLSLAVFGILGVLTRYLLEKLFGPDIIGATSDQSYMYLDLASNMVGSFLMGWFGVVFKGDISKVSNQLAIGLSTGFLGSLTTFSGWNQKMLDLSIKGRWVFAVLGIVIGLFLVAYSIIFGIETAQGLKWLYQKWKKSSHSTNTGCTSGGNSNKNSFLIKQMLVLLLILGLLLCLFATLESREFKNGGSGAQLYLACLVGPFGVWVRWYLARLNGQGLGKKGNLKWLPFGTLAANVLAASIMAALAIAKKAVRTKNCDTVVNGIQFGVLGCLSTVSTFIAEFHAMRQSNNPWRAYAYATTTILISFVLGTLIYSVPVWIKGYN